MLRYLVTKIRIKMCYLFLWLFYSTLNSNFLILEGGYKISLDLFGNIDIFAYIFQRN